MSRLSAALLPMVLAACACSSTAETSDPVDAALVAIDAAAVDTDGAPVAVDATPDAVPDAATPAIPSSHGQGGLVCTRTGAATQGGTHYPYCVATVGGVEMKIVEPAAGGAGPLHLAVYLHGDGAGPYGSDLDLRKLAPWTRTHRVLLVSALAPNGCAWWLKPSYMVCDGNTPVPDTAIDTDGENAAALNTAMDALRAAWDVADDAVLYGGSSGGSIFLTSSFLPLYGDRRPGVFALSCGGDAPFAGRLAWDAGDSALVSANALFFTYGDKDFVAPDVLQSIDFYHGLSFATDVTVIPETVADGTTSHCGNVGGTYSYDQIGRVSEVWAAASE